MYDLSKIKKKTSIKLAIAGDGNDAQYKNKIMNLILNMNSQTS